MAGKPLKRSNAPQKAAQRSIRGGKVGVPKRPGDFVPRHDPSATRLRAFRLGDGLPNIPKMMEELQNYTDVLLGRVPPPVPQGTITLMETADAYYARAAEMTMLLQQGEREGHILRGSAHYKFRTGELRTFLELAKRASDLGSRRITYEQMKGEAERYGREARMSSMGG